MGKPLTAAQRIEAAAPETAVLDAVLDAARLGGWLAAHHTDSRRMKGDPGLPDVVLAHPRRGGGCSSRPRPGPWRTASWPLAQLRVRCWVLCVSTSAGTGTL